MKLRIFIYSLVLVAISVPVAITLSFSTPNVNSALATGLLYYALMIAPIYVAIATFITLILFIKGKGIRRIESGSALLIIFVLIAILALIASNLSGISGQGSGM